LSLHADRPRVAFGGKVALGVDAKGVSHTVLQRKLGAGAWTTLAHVDGARNLTVEPQGQVLYRLSADGITGPVVAVAVAPHVQVVAAGRELLTGSVQPVSRGTVTV